MHSVRHVFFYLVSGDCVTKLLHCSLEHNWLTHLINPTPTMQTSVVCNQADLDPLSVGAKNPQAGCSMDLWFVQKNPCDDLLRHALSQTQLRENKRFMLANE